MECDSAHSAIESTLRRKSLHCSTDIFQTVALASKQNSYKVTHLVTSDILYYKLLSKKFLKNKLWDSKGLEVQWLKLKMK